MFEVLGIAGIAISVAAYVPQVVHLWREHCSAGVSTRAWTMWLASGLLIGLLAMHRRDPVFILLQVCSLTAAVTILLLAHRYRGVACQTHALPALGSLATVPDLGPSISPPPASLRSVRSTAGTAHVATYASSTGKRRA